MKVLVLGAYGLIGAAVVERLLREGHAVTGLGRDVTRAVHALPDVTWLARDLSRMTDARNWAEVLEGIDVIVNAAGVLQDGARDNVAAVQEHAMKAMYAACGPAGVRRVVQISAAGASRDAATAFMSTKAAADEALAASGLEHVILRPGLVIAPAAYGGTALLRALAATPVVTLLVHGEGRVQTVAIDEVSEAAVMAADGRIASGAALDLVERDARSLKETVVAFRAWLGYPPAPVVNLPAALGTLVARGADLLGWLGWRSPLRSTALTSIIEGVQGDAAAWARLKGAEPKSLGETLVAMPATLQDKWFARLWLMKPLLIGALALYWLATGIIAMCNDAAAAGLLLARGMSANAAYTLVWLGAIADIVLGVGVLLRAWARRALQGMIALTLAYLASGTVLTPELWADPLGPLVKALLVPVLALAALAVLEER